MEATLNDVAADCAAAGAAARLLATAPEQTKNTALEAIATGLLAGSTPSAILLTHAHHDRAVAERHQQLDPPVKIAAHPVGGGDEHARPAVRQFQP